MVVPSMLCEEEASSNLASPEFCQATVQLPQPPINLQSRPAVAGTIGSCLTTPRPESVFDEDAPVRIREPSRSPSPSPPQRLIDLDEPAAEARAADMSSTALGSPVDFIESVPRLEPLEDTQWRELWPELTTVLKHLLQPPSPLTANTAPPMPAVNAQSSHITREASSSSQEFNTAEESPLGHEPLLSRPEGAEAVERSHDFGHNLVDYLNRIIPTLPSLPAPLRPRFEAIFVSDSNISEGQVFPPGAEFVKSWRMRNNGDQAWPAATTLRFVAGDRLAPRGLEVPTVPVGSVEPGEEVEVIGGDMKAPEVPGKYVSYWRLHDGQQYFGNSVWVE